MQENLPKELKVHCTHETKIILCVAEAKISILFIHSHIQAAASRVIWQHQGSEERERISQKEAKRKKTTAEREIAKVDHTEELRRHDTLSDSEKKEKKILTKIGGEEGFDKKEERERERNVKTFAHSTVPRKNQQQGNENNFPSC